MGDLRRAMKSPFTMRVLLFFATALLSWSVCAQVNPHNHWVDGYYKSDGTYVQGHYRTNRNETVRDNYTTYPNVNPYTGQQGQRFKYSAPSRQLPAHVPQQPREVNPPVRHQPAPIFWIDASGRKVLVPRTF